MKKSLKQTLMIFFFLALSGALIAALTWFPMHLTGSLLVPAAGLVYEMPPADSPQQIPEGDKLVLGGSYILEENETLPGNLIVLGGTAKLSSGSQVFGDVLVMGGTLAIDGAVDGDVSALGGLVTLGSAAHVKGDVNAVSTNLKREDGSQVDGDINTSAADPLSIIVPGGFNFQGWEGIPPITLPQGATSPVSSVRLNPVWDALWWMIRSFIWAILAVMIALFAPKAILRTSKAAVDSPVATGGLGCLTILVFPLVLLLLDTICGIPISVIGAFGMWFAWVFGVIALGAETGKRILALLKVDWAAPVAAGIGTFILTLVANGVQLLVPCVGWVAPALIGAVGLGAVLLTRFGAQYYPPERSMVASDHPVFPETPVYNDAVLPSETPDESIQDKPEDSV